MVIGSKARNFLLSQFLSSNCYFHHCNEFSRLAYVAICTGVKTALVLKVNSISEFLSLVRFACRSVCSDSLLYTAIYMSSLFVLQCLAVKSYRKFSAIYFNRFLYNPRMWGKGEHKSKQVWLCFFFGCRMHFVSCLFFVVVVVVVHLFICLLIGYFIVALFLLIRVCTKVISTRSDFLPFVSIADLTRSHFTWHR